MKLDTDDVETLSQIFQYAANNKGHIDITEINDSYRVVITVQVMIKDGNNIGGYEPREYSFDLPKEDEGFSVVYKARVELGLA